MPQIALKRDFDELKKFFSTSKCPKMNSGPMEKNRRNVGLADLGRIQVAIVGENNPSLLTADQNGTLGCGMREVIQRSIDPRCHQKKADNQKRESFKKSFHGIPRVATIMTENQSKG